MAHDHNDIYSIVERLAILEGRITPTTVKKGLNPQQKSVPQLPALFKPKKISVLTAKTDPEHPMHGYAVGSSESQEKETAVLEAEMAEDVLEKVKKSFTDFIKQAEKSIDREVQEKKREDTDLKKKERKDRDLIAKATPVAEDPTEWDPSTTTDHSPETNPVMPESAAVKRISLDADRMLEIHGNERDGFEIRRGHKAMPSKFKTLDEAEMAVEMFVARQKKKDESRDYLDEE